MGFKSSRENRLALEACFFNWCGTSLEQISQVIVLFDSFPTEVIHELFKLKM